MDPIPQHHQPEICSIGPGCSRHAHATADVQMQRELGRCEGWHVQRTCLGGSPGCGRQRHGGRRSVGSTSRRHPRVGRPRRGPSRPCGSCGGRCHTAGAETLQGGSPSIGTRRWTQSFYQGPCQWMHWARWCSLHVLCCQLRRAGMPAEAAVLP